MSSSSDQGAPARTDGTGFAERLTAFEYAGTRTLGRRSQGAVLSQAEVDDVSVLVHEELTDEQIHRRDSATQALLAQLAEEARAAAQAQGYAVGWAQGRQAGAAAAAAEAREAAELTAKLQAETDAVRLEAHRASLAELARAAEEVRGLFAELAARVEAQATELAWELTSTLMGREVAVADSADAVRRVLDVLPGDGIATVRLHPSVASSDAAGELRAAGVTVVADPALGQPDALVERDGSVADLRIGEAMERVRQVLA